MAVLFMVLVNIVVSNNMKNKIDIYISGRNPVLLIANKVDVLPKGYKEARIKSWLYKAAREQKLKRIVGVNLVSSLTKEGIVEAANEIEYHRRGCVCYGTK